MIDESGHMVVYLAVIDHGEDEGGECVLSVHDTYEGASTALKAEGFRPACVFAGRGEAYAYRGQKANEDPRGYIDEKRVES